MERRNKNASARAETKRSPRLETVFEAIEAFVDDFENQPYSENSRSSYAVAARNFGQIAFDFGQDLSLKMLDLNLVRQILDHGMKCRDWNHSTYCAQFSRVSSFFDFCVESEKLKSNPLKGYRPRRLPAPLPNPLSEEQMELLLDSVDTTTKHGIRDRALLEFIYACGLRASEAAKMRLGNLRLEDPEFFHVRFVGKGGRREKLVPMHAECARWIRIHVATIKARSPKAFLFPSPLSQRKAISRYTVTNVLKLALKNAGIRKHFSPHNLRDSFVTHLLDHDTPWPTLRTLARLDRYETLEAYALVSKKLVARSYSRHPGNKVKSPMVDKTRKL